MEKNRKRKTVYSDTLLLLQMDLCYDQISIIASPPAEPLSKQMFLILSIMYVQYYLKTLPGCPGYHSLNMTLVISSLSGFIVQSLAFFMAFWSFKTKLQTRNAKGDKAGWLRLTLKRILFHHQSCG